MIRTSFNRDWTVAPKAPLFAALGGGPEGRPVTLPHDALRDEPRSADASGGSHTGYYPGGVFEYTKSFDVSLEHRDRTIAFEFEGAYRDAVVTINGEFAAQRPNGYSGFVVEADPFLRYGATNTIAVEVRTHEDSRWYSGAGLYRDTWMLMAEPVHIAADGIRVSTPDIEDRLAVVSAEVSVVNRTRYTSTVRVRTRVLGPDGAEVATATTPVTVLAGERATAVLRQYVAEPSRWSTESPSLYVLESEIVDDDGRVVDETSTTFGIRSLQLDPVFGLRINGETVKLRGASLHHDQGPLGAATIGRAEERRIEILKAAGFNAVRSAHNSISRAALDACDRLGMLVMDELSDVWTVSKTSFDYALAFPEWWERDVEAIVAKDFNHPSVIMYSTGNEVSEVGKAVGTVWGRRIAEKFRSLDGTRYLTNAINGVVASSDMLASAAQEGNAGGEGVNDMLASLTEVMGQLNASQLVSDRTEQAHAQVDVSGLNYAGGRYEADAEAYPNRIIVGSETFPSHLDSLWRLVEDNAHVIGDFAWTGWDYLGEAGIGRPLYTSGDGAGLPLGAPYPWLTAGCGTIDILGRRRPISFWREIVWGLREEPYIAVLRPELNGMTASIGPWAWPDVVSGWSWDVPEGTTLSVEVYSPDEEIELRLNGESIGRRRVGEEKAYVARFDVPFAPGRLEAIGYRGEVETVSSSLHSVGAPSRLDLDIDRDTVVADTVDLAYVTVTVVDEAGLPVHTADTEIVVTVEGQGVLAGLGSARPDPIEGFGMSTRTTSDGVALAIVRPTGPGRIVVTASMAGSEATTRGVITALAESDPNVDLAPSAAALPPADLRLG